MSGAKCRPAYPEGMPVQPASNAKDATLSLAKFEPIGAPEPNDHCVQVGEILILRLAGGKIVEAFEEYDQLRMRRLGVSRHRGSKTRRRRSTVGSAAVGPTWPEGWRGAKWCHVDG